MLYLWLSSCLMVSSVCVRGRNFNYRYRGRARRALSHYRLPGGSAAPYTKNIYVFTPTHTRAIGIHESLAIIRLYVLAAISNLRLHWKSHLEYTYSSQCLPVVWECAGKSSLHIKSPNNHRDYTSNKWVCVRMCVCVCGWVFVSTKKGVGSHQGRKRVREHWTVENRDAMRCQKTASIKSQILYAELEIFVANSCYYVTQA